MVLKGIRADAGIGEDYQPRRRDGSINSGDSHVKGSAHSDRPDRDRRDSVQTGQRQTRQRSERPGRHGYARSYVRSHARYSRNHACTGWHMNTRSVPRRVPQFKRCSVAVVSSTAVHKPWRGWAVYLLGLLAKIKCSICSYQLNIWYGDIVPSILNSFLSWSVPTVLACQTGR